MTLLPAHFLSGDSARTYGLGVVVVLIAGLLLFSAPAYAAGGADIRFGIYPGGGVGLVAASAGRAVADDEQLRLAALRRLRGDGRVFVLHTYASWDGTDFGAFSRELAYEVSRYTRAGFDVEPTIRYRPAVASASSPVAFAADVGRAASLLARDGHVVSLQITNEANVPNAPDAADGAYPGAVDALVRGVIAARAATRAAGRRDIRIGFNAAAAMSPSRDAAFWRELGRRGGSRLRAAVDWVGIDIYPGTWSRPTTVAAGGGRPVRHAVRNALRRLRGESFRLAGLPQRVTTQICENGYPTGLGRSETQQVTVMRASVKELLRLRRRYRITDYRWFDLRDARTGSGQIENEYGLLRDDYSEKAGFGALKSLIAKYGART